MLHCVQKHQRHLRLVNFAEADSVQQVWGQP